MKLTPKVRKTLDITTRFIIAALSLSYIFYRIYTLPAGQVNAFAESILGGRQVFYLSFLLVLLMFVNWGIESLKWKLLIAQSEKVNFFKACQAVLGGLAVSVFTPNRVGEFVGRVFILKKTEPLKAIMLTLVGSFSQLLVTLLLGTSAYVVFAPRYLPALMNNSAWLVNGFSVTLVSISSAMVIAYFNISVLHRITILLPEKYSDKIKNSFEAIATTPKQLLLKALLLSTTRYLVFSTQFYLSIRLMGLNFTVPECMMVIPVIYLALAAIPTVALTELGVRGSVSVFLFGLLANNNSPDSGTLLAIVSASTLIWLLNIAIPSLAGIFVIFRIKFFRR